ncbi:MAG TPA: DUF924 family protein [Acetobacteraceae bacterium]|jgi:uncharacterized protein (DUF924 family)|nr:DUF924 family protein [Acetobacteraceae bacterium]
MNAPDVLSFWFDGDPTIWREARWFEADPAFDREITERFGFLLNAALDGALDLWTQTAEGALALVIVLDQFSRNIHRGDYRAFAGDAHARRIARMSVDRGDDAALTPVQRVFLYMPFVHSEDWRDQHASVVLFERLRGHSEVADAVAHAVERRETIRRFGRWPARNAVLGRESTPEEIAYLAETGDTP